LSRLGQGKKYGGFKRVFHRLYLSIPVRQVEQLVNHVNWSDQLTSIRPVMYSEAKSKKSKE